jgi:hypothetical protein
MQSAQRQAELDAVTMDTARTWGTQGKRTTTTWDLNDPNALKSEQSARGPHNENHLGAASLQVMAGEDLGNRDRVKQQQRQLASWSRQQVAEKAARAQADRDEERQYKRFIDEVTEVRRQMENQSSRERKANERAMADTNSMLVANKTARANAHARDEAAANAAHASHVVNHPMLREERGQGVSAASATRVRPDHWKGFTPAQNAAVEGIVAAQQREKAAARAASAQEAAEWAQVQELTRCAADSVCYREQQERMNAAMETAMAQQRQAQEASATRNAKEAAERAYKVEDAFFQQFGTSDR